MAIKYIVSKFFHKIQISSMLDSHIHSTSKVASMSNIINCKVGKYSYIGNRCTIQGSTIGSFCSIADNCIIGGSSHPIDWVSTSPVFHNGKNILKKNFSSHQFQSSFETYIGNDVWVGSNVLIKSGVKIGNGSIIGMGSIVTKDIGDFEIWAGNPAKFIRHRFDHETKEIILKSKWWEMDEAELKEVSAYFNNTDLFISHIQKREKRNEDYTLG